MIQLTSRYHERYLIPKGVAGSTLGFCFWAASSSFLLLFHPNHPLRAERQEKNNMTNRGDN